MTTRRRSRRRSAPRRRSGRLVWVNHRLDQVALALNGSVLIDVLTSAADFMVFDTTIVSVLFTHLSASVTTSVDQATRSTGAALFVGHENLDVADITDGPLSSSIGPPWMWHSMNCLSQGVVSRLNLPLVQIGLGLFVKAQRRFKENNSTLFLVVETDVHANDTAADLTGYIRTLLRIP